MKIFAALDVSDKTTHVCVVDDEGVIVWRGVCATDPDVLASTLDRHAAGLERVVLETGPLSAFLYHGLIERGVPAVCICARHAKGVLSVWVNKSDVAKAGFVVAAIEHPGDNYRDRSRSFTSANFAARSHQVSAAIDLLTGSWRHKAMVDPARIGMFGHSAGGATTLIVGGGVLDFGQVVRFCINNPEDWGCKGGRTLNPAATRADVGAPPVAAAHPRIRARSSPPPP